MNYNTYLKRRALSNLSILLMVVGFYILSCLCSCKKEGVERFQQGDQVGIKKEAGELRGTPPFTVTAIYSHPIKDDDAFYTIVSSEGLRTLNMEDRYMILIISPSPAPPTVTP